MVRNSKQSKKALEINIGPYVEEIVQDCVGQLVREAAKDVAKVEVRKAIDRVNCPLVVSTIVREEILSRLNELDFGGANAQFFIEEVTRKAVAEFFTGKK